MNNFIFFLTECPDEYEILRIIYFIKMIIQVVTIVVPIGLIVMIGIDFFKNVTAFKEEDMKKNLSIAIKRIIYCVCIFFVPTIVDFTFAILGDLGVDYATYETCANSNDIEDAIVRKAEQLVTEASSNLDYSVYSEAYDVVMDIQDESLKSQYESRLESIKTQIEANRPEEPDDTGGGSGGNSGGTGNIDNKKFDEDTVNLFAAGIAMEAGGEPSGFKCQLITGAVMVNNMYTTVSRTGGKAIKSDSGNITYNDLKNMFSYCPVYCNSGGSKMDYINAKGGGLGYLKSTGADDSRIKQLQIVAKILLSREFTIPQDILGQGTVADWSGMNYTVWGKAPTGLGSSVVTFAVINNIGVDGTKDVYGNTVSKNFDDYQAIADKLYNKYVN